MHPRVQGGLAVLSNAPLWHSGDRALGLMDAARWTLNGLHQSATTSTVMLSIEPRADARSQRARAAPRGSEERSTDAAHCCSSTTSHRPSEARTRNASRGVRLMAESSGVDETPYGCATDGTGQARASLGSRVGRQTGWRKDGGLTTASFLGKVGRRKLDCSHLEMRVTKGARYSEVALNPPAASVDHVPTGRLGTATRRRWMRKRRRQGRMCEPLQSSRGRPPSGKRRPEGTVQRGAAAGAPILGSIPPAVLPGHELVRRVGLACDRKTGRAQSRRCVPVRGSEWTSAHGATGPRVAARAR